MVYIDNDGKRKDKLQFTSGVQATVSVGTAENAGDELHVGHNSFSNIAPWMKSPVICRRGLPSIWFGAHEF